MSPQTRFCLLVFIVYMARLTHGDLSDRGWWGAAFIMVIFGLGFVFGDGEK